ncbi:protein SHQ1 homolog [Toxorhynchites rutilus septentrionalis]|uniref:protein SHQ1 homolog n=1 Tax=Toxorhynchites rutilus septentrionalis TaxID=329112 RepID=UPI002479311D|nr:protein SHQ1 homolog [Toxorhynchites rutilus septentrionalis]
MDESTKYSLEYTESFVVLTINTPELDLEQDGSISMEVSNRELVFTAPPYHLRLPVERDLVQAEVFPISIDYEKCVITYHIPIREAVHVTKDSMDDNHKYGFGNFYSGMLNIINSQDFKTLSNPEKKSNEERRKTRLLDEQNDFDAEYYGMDYVQNEIDGFGLRTNCIPIAVKLTSDQTYRIGVIVEEKKRSLGSYSPLQKDGKVIRSLVDILLATLYDKLINCNEANEAMTHVTIHRISATLSYFENFDTLEEVLVAFYRRCCIYPLYRSKDLAKVCVHTLAEALDEPSFDEWILEKLMYCYEAFKTNECVLLNQYYIKDYIRFVKTGSSNEEIRQVSSEILKLLPRVHVMPLGFDEEHTVRRFLSEIIGKEDATTDSDDSSGSESEDETETDNSTDDEQTVEKPEESVLDRLMNLKIQA